jgi:hypothetical protein
MEFLTQFKAARRVSTPLVAVRTFDAKSTIDGVRTLFDADTLPPFIIWDCAQGFKVANQGTKSATIANGIVSTAIQACNSAIEATIDIKEALRIAECFNGTNNNDPIVFLSNLHLFWSEREVIQGVWNIRDTYKAKGNMLVLLCSAGSILPTELTNDILILDEPLPTVDVLKKIVFDTFEFAGVTPPTDTVIENAVNALNGLPYFPAEQSTAMCLTANKKTKLGTLDIHELWERKRQVINQTPGLTVWQGNESLDDIGGLEAIKTYLTRVCEGKGSPNVFIFLDEIEKAFAGTGTDTSGVTTKLTGGMLQWLQDKNIQGVILLGVPGAGKTQIAKAIGTKFNKPVIAFNLSSMESSLVGSSQSNLRQAQATIDAVGGGKVFAIATSNGMDALPAELLARFQSGTFFFDVPTNEEKESIWKIYRAKYNVPDSEPLPDTTGWTGREIKACALTAYNLGITLVEASQYVVPITDSQQDRIENLKRNSSGKYLSASKTGKYHYEPASVPTHVPEQVTGRKMRD